MNDNTEHYNNLIHETSPYLLQHAYNPVHWYPWGGPALKKAKEENKLLIISIGYAACHWCHVMEKECFEDAEVAEIMNRHYVSIKVDREERPDVDQVYMTAAQLITGRGGWPLNALALPDGKPFYAGTYYPKKDWINLLLYFVEIRDKKNSSLILQAEEVTRGINASEKIIFKNSAEKFSPDSLGKYFSSIKPSIDFKKGGAARVPKFPMPSDWEYLLHYYYLSKNEEALQAATVTLDNMAYGGIYDHIGGGFARYSTDRNWHVPHFEKMLYDNAQLVSLYAHAFQLTKKPLYKKVAEETLEFISREMTSPEGGFYSSLDADSEGEEGKFYVWTKSEIDAVLGTDSPLFSAYYNITEPGNWEKGKNILFRNPGEEALAAKFQMELPELTRCMENSRNKLLINRDKRIRPGLDDKILTSWNALMLKGYAQAYRAFNNEDYLAVAVKNAEFLLKHAVKGNKEITRNYKSGRSTIPGMLDDYAFIISAFTELYQATFDIKWLEEAGKITKYTLEHFFDQPSGMFFYTHDRYSDLISRKMEISDNVIPSSNSAMAGNLLVLGHYFQEEDYISKAGQMLINVQEEMNRSFYFYSNWGIQEALMAGSIYEVAIAGEGYKSKRQELDQYYLPDVILAGAGENADLKLLENKFIPGQTMIYVCSGKVCKNPVTDVKQALSQIGK